LLAALAGPAAAQAPPATTTPIEHLIVVVGENLRVDNLFGVYEPRSGEWPFQITKHVGDDEPISDLTSLFQF